MKNKSTAVALRTCLIYAAIGGAWILLSGRILFALVSDPDVRVQLEIYKGWGFVAVTALLLYFMLRSQLDVGTGKPPSASRSEGELRGKTALLEAQMNSSTGRHIGGGQRGEKNPPKSAHESSCGKFLREIVDNQDNTAQIQFVMNRVKNPGTICRESRLSLFASGRSQPG